jgi:hypothetical protein
MNNLPPGSLPTYKIQIYTSFLGQKLKKIICMGNGPFDLSTSLRVQCPFPGSYRRRSFSVAVQKGSFGVHSEYSKWFPTNTKYRLLVVTAQLNLNWS